MDDLEIAHNLRDLVSRLNRNLRKQSGNNEQLSIVEENVIRALLIQEEALPSELCSQLNISSQFMSQVLKQLEKLGYISRKPSKTDKRKSSVLLSRSMMAKLEQKRKKRKIGWLPSFQKNLISNKKNR